MEQNLTLVGIKESIIKINKHLSEQIDFIADDLHVIDGEPKRGSGEDQEDSRPPSILTDITDYLRFIELNIGELAMLKNRISEIVGPLKAEKTKEHKLTLKNKKSKS